MFRRNTPTKQVRQTDFPCEGAHHNLFLNSEKSIVSHRAGRRGADRLIGNAVFSNKVLIAQDVESCFLAVPGSSAESYSPFENDQDDVCLVIQSLTTMLRVKRILATRLRGRF